MLFDVILERFCEQAPFAVMLRASLERLFSPERLDELFEREAVDQYTKKLTFSAVTDLLCSVVLRVRPSVRKAYQSAPGLPATLRAVYDKLARVETATAQALVRRGRHPPAARCPPRRPRRRPAPGDGRWQLPGRHPAPAPRAAR